ncbi:nucleolar protein 8 [Protopterus annectens]|uniref:nucleolar protein 8 n=1 Tax=Protopterus annectens TaxID=7888 RepID=UPI001CFB0667|nr:nucleolar protein 8 [Protopterus annectens]XP_043933341.1 nucleolar protein 8 [Protopterus annectens]
MTPIMEKNKALKRLYIGGLSHTISQAELQERFSKFGDVTDVEIITRKDEQGLPVKTFGYLNINISEPDFHKCVSILNKTRWKGGTLQVEQAKESFLHRLAMERQEAKEKAASSSVKDSKNNAIESLKKVGIVDFYMKAAVPGTEVPDHKNWVVSKYGRVLPVLHLREQRKRKITKYDPSKYCHNIKKFEQTTGQDITIPISQLTWHLEGGDDDISKKRRGEFPSIKTQSNKKMKSLNTVEGESTAAESTLQYPTGKKELPMQKHLKQMTACKRKDSPELGLVNKQLNKNEGKEAEEKMCSSVKRALKCIESDVDSEEELRLLIEQERKVKHRSANVPEGVDHLEVVGDNFHLKYDTHWASKTSKKVNTSAAEDNHDDDESEYDSADTDEIISLCKPKANQSSKTKTTINPEFRVKKNEKFLPSHETKSKVSEDTNSFTQNLKLEENYSSSKPTTQTKDDKGLEIKCNRKSESSTSGSSSSDSEDSSYDTMMKNCVRIDLSLDDLKQLASKSSSSSDEESKENGSHYDSAEGCENSESVESSLQSKPLPRKRITPDEVVSAILEEESSEEERKPRKKAKFQSLPAFRGMKAFLGIGDPDLQVPVENGPSALVRTKANSEQVPLNTLALKKQKTVGNEETVTESDSGSEENSSPVSKPPPFKGMSFLQKPPDFKENPESRTPPGMQSMKTSSQSNSLEDKSSTLTCKLPTHFTSKSQTSSFETITEGKVLQPVNSHSGPNDYSCNTVLNVMSKKVSLETASTGHISDSEAGDNGGGVNCESSVKAKKEPETFHHCGLSKNMDRQLLDNQKRLAALQQKQKEAEMQKRLIQEALSKVDDHSANKRQHIVFDSDNEENIIEQKQLSKKLISSGVKKPLICQSDEESESSGEMEEKGKSKESIAKTKIGFGAKVPGKLFQSSSDEISDDEGLDHFKIRPQFEGTAGQKLMKLQSRFGADERFRMDARFLDSDGEENTEEDTTNKIKDDDDLAAEKKKNLEILQRFLHVSVEMPESKKEATKKQFRDVGALHYDPTREDHAVFETKVEEPKKQSKAERKKKRQEAEKLPEVSKEMYYDIAVDLKKMLTSTKIKDEKKENKIAWDKQEEEENKENRSLGMDPGTEQNSELTFEAFSVTDNEEPSGFKFSFFGIGTEEPKESAECVYKNEGLRAAKVPWQEDPRFQDSSSEEEEEDEGSEDLKTELSSKSENSRLANKMNLFFFFKDDERLREGPKIFCRPSVLEEQRDSWEEKRSSLIEEYRKKHKDAKRKVKSRL